jgi:hypothetical protein
MKVNKQLRLLFEFLLENKIIESVYDLGELIQDAKPKLVATNTESVTFEAMNSNRFDFCTITAKESNKKKTSTTCTIEIVIHLFSFSRFKSAAKHFTFNADRFELSDLTERLVDVTNRNYKLLDCDIDEIGWEATRSRKTKNHAKSLI